MSATHLTSDMNENRATWKNLKGDVEDALDYLLTAQVYTEMVDLDDEETVEDAHAQETEAWNTWTRSARHWMSSMPRWTPSTSIPSPTRAVPSTGSCRCAAPTALGSRRVPHDWSKRPFGGVRVNESRLTRPNGEWQWT